ncbi:hypothetical protein BE18_11500 [Sorangium cellulosum]|uniref:DUF4157 domain-containing protein n=1 Tax=Sorangium cellulosum TaxID=56 RepID=A0A150SDF6_SORCE|nr:hypothetical protein BE18_11500 [Sorangium cellulosum]
MIGGNRTGTPARLTLSRPGDRYEQEADRVADAVMRRPAPAPAEPSAAQVATARSLSPAGSTLARMCSSCEEETLQRQTDAASSVDALADVEDPEADVDDLEADVEASEADVDGLPEDPDADVDSRPEDPSGMPARAPGIDGPTTVDASIVPRGSGVPLDGATRAFMEPRFGVDFGRVRIHADAEAARSAELMRATAYTIGRNIYFGAGRYRPADPAGQRLLAHELAHVVQQSGGGLTATAQRQARRRPGRRRGGTRPGTARPRAQQRGAQRTVLCTHTNRQMPCAARPSCDRCSASRQSEVVHPACGNETCAGSSAANGSNFIRHIDVNKTTQQMTLLWGTRAATARAEGRILVSPNVSRTPSGSFSIGQKCGACHTNRCAEGMGWFAGFSGLTYGFHDSQRVGRGVQSHGCVRVLGCNDARRIHDNTSSGVTSVCIHTGAHCNHPHFRRPSGNSGPSPRAEPRRPAARVSAADATSGGDDAAAVS